MSHHQQQEEKHQKKGEKVFTGFVDEYISDSDDKLGEYSNDSSTETLSIAATPSSDDDESQDDTTILPKPRSSKSRRSSIEQNNKNDSEFDKEDINEITGKVFDLILKKTPQNEKSHNATTTTNQTVGTSSITTKDKPIREPLKISSLSANVRTFKNREKIPTSKSVAYREDSTKLSPSKDLELISLESIVINNDNEYDSNNNIPKGSLWDNSGNGVAGKVPPPFASSKKFNSNVIHIDNDDFLGRDVPKKDLLGDVNFDYITSIRDVFEKSLMRDDFSLFAKYLQSQFRHFDIRDYGEKTMNEAGFKTLVITSLSNIFDLFGVDASILSEYELQANDTIGSRKSTKKYIDILVKFPGETKAIIIELKYLQLQYLVTSPSIDCIRYPIERTSRRMRFWSDSTDLLNMNFKTLYSGDIQSTSTTVGDKLREASFQAIGYKNLFAKNNKGYTDIKCISIVGAVNKVFATNACIWEVRM